LTWGRAASEVDDPRLHSFGYWRPKSHTGLWQD